MKYIISWSAFFLIILLSPGCEDYLDINENPNVATEPPLDGLLANGTYETALNHFRVSETYSNYFVQYFASPNEGSLTDTYGMGDYSGTWANLYDVMTDLYDLETIGSQDEAWHHVGVARILLAMNLGLLHDSWGSVPYSDAFTGETLTPEYDSGEQIYETILSLLDSGIEAMQRDEVAVALASESDFIHQGNVERWIKTARVLKARYMNHLTKKSSYDPNDVLEEIDNGGYTSNADDAEMSTFRVRNPWAQVAIDNDNLFLNGWLSEQVIDAMNGTTFGVFDPRLPVITDSLPSGGYVGTPNGGGRIGDGTVQEECYLELGTYYASENSPLLLVTFFEMKFIEAEAALRAGLNARALNAFIEGVETHMLKLGLSSTVFNNYFNEAYPNLQASNLTMDHIMREKYIAMFLHPEAWTDARRYDYQYQDFELPENAELNDYIRRVLYPSTERDRNGSNVPSTDLLEHLYWDMP